MIKRNRILAGTAIGLLMTATSLGASPLSIPLPSGSVPASTSDKPLILVQDTGEERVPEQGQAEQPAEEPAAQEQPPAEQEAPAEQQAEPQQADPEPQPEAAPEPEAAPAQEEAQPAPEPAPEPTPDAGEDQGQAEPEPSAEEPPAASEPSQEQAEPAQPEQEEVEPEQQQAEPEAPAEPEAAEEDPAQEEAPAEEQAAPEEPASEEPASEEAQPGDAAPADEPTRAEGEDTEEPAAEPGTAEERPAEEDATQDQGQAGEQEPTSEEGASDAAEQTPEGEQPTDEGQAAGEQQPEDAAPVLDSQKEQQQQPADGDAATGQAEDGEADALPEQQSQEEEEAGPPPDSDSAAQQDLQIEEIRPVTAEEGRRIDNVEVVQPQRREGARVIEEIGDRFVVEFNNTTIVQSPDRERVRWRSRDYYYEELPGDRTREVVIRDNGIQVITIRNRYGDVIRRSRITPDGEEYVLVYAGERENWNEWHDPAADLPPLQLTIPVEEYILEAEPAVSPDDYYAFLDQPPVEPVERLYTVDEVKYSARIRDTVRRVDLDTITFEFGSDEIAESEIQTLEDVAVAMERLIEENPGETFLIEGHTDAVGSDTANLALSDRRAEAVAEALTNVFAIPPENMFTQGYGEQYLKIDTEEPARENRRVAIRRITPLVQPVASAE